MKKHVKVLCLLLALVMLMLTACGSSAQPAEEGGAKRDDVNLSVYQYIATLNPWDTILIPTKQLLCQIYDPLMWTNDAGELEPRIATDYDISADGLTYTFTIRDDVYFHNGEKVTAQDVAWSANYAIRDGEAKVKANTMPTFVNAEVVDDTHVAFTISEPTATFLQSIASLEVLCEKEVMANLDKFGVEPIPCGAGPYVITSYAYESEVKLQAFDKYYRGEAAIKNATIKIIPDNNTLQVAFESGELDMIAVPTASWSRVENNEKYTTELVSSRHLSYILINNSDRDHPLNNKLVRQAMNYACDREAVLLAAYDGMGEVAVSFFNPNTVAGAPDHDGLAALGIETYDYNPEKAKELLAEAGYPDGVNIGNLVVPAGGYWPKLCTAFQQQCADVGIIMEQESIDAATAGARYAELSYDAAGGGVNIDNGEIINLNNLIFAYTDEDFANGINNQFGIQDEELQAAFDKANGIADPAERQDAYNEIIRILNENAYIVPVFHKSMPYAWDANLNVDMTLDYYYIYNMSWK